MLRTRSRKIWSDVFARRGRTALVVLSIAIGVLGVSMLVGMGDLIISQLEEDLPPEELPMLSVGAELPQGRLSLEDNRPILAQLAAIPGVTDVEARASYRIQWRKAEWDDYADDGINAYSEDWAAMEIEPISRVIEGRFPEGGKNEIAVERRLAELHDLKINDVLYIPDLATPGQETVWTVVGIVFHAHPGWIEEIDYDERLYATYEDAQKIAGFGGFNVFNVRYDTFEAAKSGQDYFLETMTTTTPYRPFFSYTDNPEDSLLMQNVTSVTDVLTALAIIGMVVSAFLVINIINTVIVEQKKQIGVMKSIGASRVDTFFIYAGMAFVYGFFGTIIGVIAGTVLAGLISPGLAEAAYAYIDGFKVSSQGVLVGLVMGMVVPPLVAFFPVFNGTRVRIIDAMTDLGIASKWGKGPLARMIAALPLPLSMRQAFSNVTQKRGRLALTGITLTLAVAAFMGVTAVFLSIRDQIEALFDTFNYEIQIDPRESRTLEEIESSVAGLEGIQDVFPGYSTLVSLTGFESGDPLNLGSSQIFALGIEPASPVFNFDLTDGEGWKADNTRLGVILTQPVADQLDKGAGDRVTLTVQGQPHDYEILGVTRFSQELVFMPWRELATISDYTDAEGNPQPSTFFLQMEGDPSIDAVADKIEEVSAALSTNGIQAVYNNQPEIAAEEVASVDVFLIVFNLVSAVMAAVGAVGLLAALSMAVYERQKEIGVMRSIGGNSSTIVAQFMTEGLTVGIISWLLAIPISYGLGYMLIQVLNLEGLSFGYPAYMIGVGLLGVIIVAAIASIWPSVAASRKTISDILRYQ